TRRTSDLNQAYEGVQTGTQQRENKNRILQKLDPQRVKSSTGFVHLPWAYISTLGQANQKRLETYVFSVYESGCEEIRSRESEECSEQAFHGKAARHRPAPERDGQRLDQLLLCVFKMDGVGIGSTSSW